MRYNDRVWRACAGAALGLLLVACGGNEATAFPAGLEPLEENTAVAPAAEGDQPHPERINVVSGDRGTYVFAHGRGYVHGTVAETWAALQVPEAVTDRRGVDRYSSTPNVEEGYDVSFRVHNEVDDIVTVQFDVTWRQSAVEGTLDSPTVVAIRWQKTWGTTFITSIEGSIILRVVDDSTTEIDAVEHMKAARDPQGQIHQYLLDVHANTVALVHGQPLPVF